MFHLLVPHLDVPFYYLHLPVVVCELRPQLPQRKSDCVSQDKQEPRDILRLPVHVLCDLDADLPFDVALRVELLGEFFCPRMCDVGPPREEAHVRALHDHLQEDVHVVVVLLGVKVPGEEAGLELFDDAHVLLEVGGMDKFDDALAEVYPLGAAEGVEDVGLRVGLDKLKESRETVVLGDRDVVVLDGEVVLC